MLSLDPRLPIPDDIKALKSRLYELYRQIANAVNAIGQGQALPSVTKTAAYTVSTTDYTIRVDATAGAVVIALPATPLPGEIHVVKKVDASANVVTVAGNGRNIDGAANLAIGVQYLAYMVQYDQTANVWGVI